MLNGIQKYPIYFSMINLDDGQGVKASLSNSLSNLNQKMMLTITYPRYKLVKHFRKARKTTLYSIDPIVSTVRKWFNG